mmetsp:Transcript_29170/g.44105  ORF Transcript_29170/g.44105 Transcript_29170/m.44105 type:complete len:92 (-) Transcript_29170:49-324(-)
MAAVHSTSKTAMEHFADKRKKHVRVASRMLTSRGSQTVIDNGVLGNGPNAPIDVTVAAIQQSVCRSPTSTISASQCHKFRDFICRGGTRNS